MELEHLVPGALFLNTGTLFLWLEVVYQVRDTWKPCPPDLKLKYLIMKILYLVAELLFSIWNWSILVAETLVLRLYS
jgi:hypothetical protein